MFHQKVDNPKFDILGLQRLGDPLLHRLVPGASVGTSGDSIFHIPPFSSYDSRAKIFTLIFLFLDELQVSSVHGNPSYSGKAYSTANLIQENQ